MIDTFFASGSLDTTAAFLASLLIGVLFGFVLERAGFGSSRRLAGVFYFTDMTVVKVMFSALITAMLGLVVLRQTGLVTLDNLYFLETVYGAQIVGGLLFGFGFAIGGWCPGTAAAGLGAGKLDALVFLLGAVGGGILFNEAYALVKPLNSVGNQGVQFVYESLGLSLPTFAALFTLLAVAAFWACEWVESRAAGPGDTRILVAFSAALVVAATAVVLMSAGELATRASLSPCATPGQAEPAPATVPSQPGADTPAAASRFLAAVARAEDHVEPEELADGLMANEPGLLVLDVRTPVEFATFHLRGALQVELDGLPAFLAARPEARRVVLYSNGMTHPAQARDALQRLGHRQVFILTDGLTGFLERCLTPVSLRDGPVEPGLASRIARWRAHFLNQRSAAAPVSPDAASEVGEVPALVDAAWLNERLTRPDARVIDLRPQPDYNSGHIPGALSLNFESLRGNLGGVGSMLLPAKQLAGLFSLLGLRPDDIVVLVHGDALHDATLAAVALRRVGHRRVTILDGGHSAWLGAGLPVSRELPAVAASDYPAPTGPDSFTVDAGTVDRMRREAGVVVLDVRPAEYFTGVKSDEARPGHIPGARSRPHTADHRQGSTPPRLLPRETLAAEYAKLLGAVDTPVVVHCRTGHQASQTWWVLTQVLGYRNVSWYDGGWTEWAARPEFPVSTGPGE